ncbi:MFS transporter [Acidimicrobiaceae bacterium USS-CC1]|uniref:MFS transporter n=1 Tax=Acidiferrimicrobium australe TaxID=2664430 RepID=A0ABW9QUS6_9ACTN|nr:MFS transporter [Acidiferrimicrobium australe]
MRLPQPMSLLAFQLAGLQATGSIGKGALLVGITGFCGLLGPWTGRRRDRGSMRRRLQGSCLAGSAALAGMGACVHWHGPYGLLVVLAVLQGSAIAGMWAGFRALLVQVAPHDKLRQAHFVESFMVEVSFAAGPLLVMGVVRLEGVAGALICMAVGELAGGAILFGVPDLRGVGAAAGSRVRRFAPGVRRPVLAISALAFVLGLGFSMIEANVPARMAPYGLPPSAAGTYMAALAGGSCLGGLLVSFRPLSRRRSVLQAGVLFGLLGVLSLPSALAASASAYLAMLPINSLALVPLNGLGSAELERRLGQGSRGEAFGWFNAAMRLGGGTGATLNGLLLSILRPADVPLLASGVFLCMPVVLAGAALARRVP